MSTNGDQQNPSQVREMLLELNRNESRILFERLKGMLTFQGFLFASVAVCASNHLFILPILISLAGGLACIPWRFAGRISYRGEDQLKKQMSALNARLEEGGRLPPLDAVDVEPWEFGLLPEVALPVAVGCIWILVIAYLIVRSILGPIDG